MAAQKKSEKKSETKQVTTTDDVTAAAEAHPDRMDGAAAEADDQDVADAEREQRAGGPVATADPDQNLETR